MDSKAMDKAIEKGITKVLKGREKIFVNELIDVLARQKDLFVEPARVRKMLWLMRDQKLVEIEDGYARLTDLGRKSPFVRSMSTNWIALIGVFTGLVGAITSVIAVVISLIALNKP